MSDLIDPSKLRISRATHEAGGVILHDEADCPKDATCPVWAAWHKPSLEEQIAAHEDAIWELRAQQKAEATERAKSVKPVFKFTVEPDERKFDKIFDPSIKLYRLTGTVVNAAELESVGAQVPSGGSMSYLFNTGTGRIVMSHGGGHIFLPSEKPGFSPRADAVEALGKFIVENPAGGDFTAILTELRSN